MRPTLSAYHPSMAPSPAMRGSREAKQEVRRMFPFERGRVFGQLAANLARNGLVGFQERRGEILLRRSYPEGYSFVVAIVPEQ